MGQDYPSNASEAIAAQAARIRRALYARAVRWLKRRWRRAGRDYPASAAVEVADETAFREVVRAFQAGRRFYAFPPRRCLATCRGWNGKTALCDCGASVVWWARGDGHTFEQPDVRIEST